MGISLQPNVTVVDFTAAGITLVPYSSPQFGPLLTGALPENVSKELSELLPYSVLIRNGSAKAVIAYTVSWASVDKAGQPDVHYGTVCDAIALKGLILPYTDGLVTIIGPVSASLANHPQVARDIAEQAHRFKDQASVTIALEAVVFDDGTIIGTDRSRSADQVRGILRSEYDLYRSVIARADRGEMVPEWLLELADQIRPGSTIRFGDNPFLQWYRFYQSRSAAELLKMIAQEGLAKTISDVRFALQTKRYPPLIVNP